MPNYVELSVQINGLDRWGKDLSHEQVRTLVEQAVREKFPQREYEEDIIVEIEEESGAST